MWRCPTKHASKEACSSREVTRIGIGFRAGVWRWIRKSLAAYTQGLNLWPIFLSGFAGLFIFTQMHRIGLSCITKGNFAAI